MLGLKLIDNTDFEIESAIKEMYLYNENNLDLTIHKKKQKLFWDNYYDFYKFQTKNLIISPSFYNNNLDLFN